MRHLAVLDSQGYVERTGVGHRITHLGMEVYGEWRRSLSLLEEFESISKLEPQPRGRALQKLFAKVVEFQGWEQEEGVRNLPRGDGCDCIQGARLLSG